MAYVFEEEILMLLTGLLSSVPSMLFWIASYVLSAVAIYTISRRRGLNKPWLAWIPVVNVWLLGSLSDQYQYVVNRRNHSKRKVLLILSIVMHLLTAVILVLGISLAGTVLFGDYRPGNSVWAGLMGHAAGIAGMALPLAGAAIAYAVIRYMALYDLYKSLDPANCVLFLVLSICFSVTEPFFLFFSREKDKGMPPRKQEPVYEAEPVGNSWENKDYL